MTTAIPRFTTRLESEYYGVTDTTGTWLVWGHGSQTHADQLADKANAADREQPHLTIPQIREALGLLGQPDAADRLGLSHTALRIAPRFAVDSDAARRYFGVIDAAGMWLTWGITTREEAIVITTAANKLDVLHPGTTVPDLRLALRLQPLTH